VLNKFVKIQPSDVAILTLEPTFNVTLFEKNVPTVAVKFVGEVNDEVAPETASTAPNAAAEPIPQRRIIAKLELAAGLVMIFLKSGNTCSAAASNNGNICVSRFMMLVVLGFRF